jgi:hypothetical protein
MLRRRIRPLSRLPDRGRDWKGEEIRDLVVGRIWNLRNRLIFGKGEGFRDAFGRLEVIKVREFRTEMPGIGRKSPTDAG